MEHEFIGPGGFVHAVAVCRQRVIDTSAAAIAELLVQLHCAGACKTPPSKMPVEVCRTSLILPFNIFKVKTFYNSNLSGLKTVFIHSSIMG